MGINKGSRLLLVAASVLFLAFTGCKKQEPQKAAEAPAAPAGPGTGQGAQPGAQQQGAQAQPGLPQGHPAVEQKQQDQITMAAHANLKTQKEIKLSDEVRNKWKEVKLEITNASTNGKEVVDMKVGQTVTLTKDGLRLRVETLVPDYAITENRVITSRSNEANNPAVLVELLEGEKPVARGWVFRDLPEFNSYKDPRFPIALVAPAKKKK